MTTILLTSGLRNRFALNTLARAALEMTEEFPCMQVVFRLKRMQLMRGIVECISMTNGDKIRAMTDYDLAMWIAGSVLRLREMQRVVSANYWANWFRLEDKDGKK